MHDERHTARGGYADQRDGLTGTKQLWLAAPILTVLRSRAAYGCKEMTGKGTVYRDMRYLGGAQGRRVRAGCCDNPPAGGHASR